VSDEHFEQDLRDAVQSLAPPGAPDSLRQRAAAIPSTAPPRSLFARWGVAAGGAVAAAAAVAVLVLALAQKPVIPSPDGSPNPSASVPSETGDFAPISIAFWSIGSGVAGGPGSGGQGVVEVTRDGGRSWTLSYLAPGPVTHVTVAGTADAWALVDCEHRVREPCTPLAHTGDGGLSWSVIQADEVTMSFADATHGWGLTPGTAGVVQTDDGGQSWTTPSQPCRDPFKTPVTLAVHPSAGVWVVCTDGSTDLTSVGISVMVSINGGRSWEQRVARGGGIAVGNIPTRGFPTGLSVGRDGFAWMWGTEMDLLASSDGGHTWTAANTGLMQPTALIAASHPGAGHDLALFLDRGERMTHLEETSNGGTTWVERFRWVLAPSASLPVVHATPAPTSTPAPQAPRSTTYLRRSASLVATP
jgi:photosystem II stability/assembly factor-like uncharacterized protein